MAKASSPNSGKSLCSLFRSISQDFSTSNSCTRNLINSLKTFLQTKFLNHQPHTHCSYSDNLSNVSVSLDFPVALINDLLNLFQCVSSKILGRLLDYNFYKISKSIAENFLSICMHSEGQKILKQTWFVIEQTLYSSMLPILSHGYCLAISTRTPIP